MADVENTMKDYVKLRNLVQRAYDESLINAAAIRDKRLEAIKIVRGLYTELDLARRRADMREKGRVDA